MSEWALPELLKLVKIKPISKSEFRRLTGLSQPYVQDVFTEAESAGLIRETGETWKDRSRRPRGPGSPRYEAVPT